MPLSLASYERFVALRPIQVCAEVVSYADLRETGVRIPDRGLSINGPVTQALQYLPEISMQNQQAGTIIGVWSPSSAEMVFFPEGLRKVGLCVPATLPPSSENNRILEEPASLTPIGCSVVELVWLGSLAVSNLGAP